MKMDSDLYNAAVNGNVSILHRKSRTFDTQFTPQNNTVLHLASIFGQTNAVTAILRTHAQSLLPRVNSQGENALHLAARHGHISVVQILIQKSKSNSLQNPSPSWLWNANTQGDTALHEAVRYHHTQVANVLINEDIDHIHPTNNSDETPLYLAASRGFFDLVGVILNNCRSLDGPAYGGPYSTTALHAAVICKNNRNSEDCMDKLLNSVLDLTKEVDIYGQTPLHYAAHYGCTNRVMKLLDKDDTALYTSDNDKNTPLHIAASKGDVSIMRLFISQRPDCCHAVDKKGRNILHIVVKKEKKNAVEYLLKSCQTASELIVQKDIEGNTPLHLLATTSNFFVKKLVQHYMVDNESLNKEKLTPFELVNYNRYDVGDNLPKLQIEDEMRSARASWGYPNSKKIIATIKGDPIPDDVDHIPTEYVPFDPRKIVDNHIIVSTLIATVTFAAGFALPGGYIQSGSKKDAGMAVLTEQPSFKVFMIFDTIALICSVVSIVVYSTATDYMTRKKIKSLSRIGGTFAINALIAMMVAFTAGTYSVLSHSKGIAFSTLAIGCITFPAIIVVLLRYGRDYLSHDM